MQLPVVRKFGFSCSLRNGTKFYGWFNLVCAIFYFLDAMAIWQVDEQTLELDVLFTLYIAGSSVVLLLAAYEENPKYVPICGILLAFKILLSFSVYAQVLQMWPSELLFIGVNVYGVLVVLSYHHELTNNLALRSTHTADST